MPPPPTLTDDELDRLDRELVRLTRGYARERVGLGLVLDALGLRFREFGFRRFDLYVRERASQSPGWCVASRALAGRLRERPRICAALLSGQVGWSLAELLARHSTPEDEDELLEATRGMGIREVRSALRARGAAETDLAEPDGEAFVTIDLPASPEESLVLEGTRAAIEHINGGVIEPGCWLECLLSEGTASLLEYRPDLVPEFRADLDALAAERRRRREREAEGQGDASPRTQAMTPELGHALEEIDVDQPAQLDAMVVERASRLASRDVWLGLLLRRFLAARGWERLGYGSEQLYFDERLGIARSTARSRVTLVARMEWLEGLGEALQSGRVGYEQASLIARVASPDTLPAWIERAELRTYQHLREEVHVAEMVARASGETPVMLSPPTDEELAIVREFEQDVLSGEAMARPFVEEQDTAREEVSEEAREEAREEAPIQMSACFAAGPRRGSVRVRVREDVALQYWLLARAFRGSGSPSSFVFFLATTFWRTWGPSFFLGNRWKAIHDRDRHRCVSPVCNSRNATNHHLRYRSHGGGDEMDNQITLCEFCHLEGEHGGRLKVRGTASDLTWDFGRPAVLRVEGRVRMSA